MDIGTALLISVCAAGIVIAIAVARKAVLSSRIEPDGGISGGSLPPEAGTKAIVSKTLRPIGVIAVEGVPYEAASEGEFVEPGAEVIVIGNTGPRALVRRIR